ncbi:MAG TPA: hypothetical protein VK851_00190 [Anaerolineales bacterium]|nr:hypothetical protein [Anaerolineales bacterium]
MSRLILIDPEYLDATGHHRSADLELGKACEELGLEFCLLDRSHFGCRTYLSDIEIKEWLEQPHLILEDYARISIHPGDMVLMHTASPWHLFGLVNRIKDLRGVKIAVGLIYPVQIWSADEAVLRQLSQSVSDLVKQLSGMDAFLYTETGYLDLGTHRVELPSLVLPLSRASLSRIKSLKSNQQCDYAGKTRFGFFGQPRTEKGFDSLLSLLSQNTYSDKEFHFFLPTAFKRLEPRIQSSRGSNSVATYYGAFDQDQYFEAMASCHAVLCFYDPKYYGAQMSGIVTEAPLLGKATVISSGTEPEKFLQRYCPGTHVSVAYTHESLHNALSLPIDVWSKLSANANASESLLMAIKSARRFLQIALSARF